MRIVSGPTFAHGITKTLNQEWSMGLDQAIEAEAQAQAICMQTRDFERAYKAFVAKEKLVFQIDATTPAKHPPSPRHLPLPGERSAARKVMCKSSTPGTSPPQSRGGLEAGEGYFIMPDRSFLSWPFSE